MSDDQDAQNEQDTPHGEGDGEDYGDAYDSEQTTTTISATTTTPVADIAEDGGGDADAGIASTTTIADDYVDDEVLPDVTVNLYINELPEGGILSPDVINAGITDMYGNIITPSTPLVDFTQGVYDQLSGNDTDITGKGWWGVWSWQKILFVGLIALCIIGILLAIIFMVIGKKFKKRSTTATTSREVRGNVPPPGSTKYGEVPSNP